jgi:hypothetical protein
VKLHNGVYDTNPETASEFPHGPVIEMDDGRCISFDLHMEPQAVTCFGALAKMPRAPLPRSSLLQNDVNYLRKFTDAITPNDVRGWFQERLENCLRHAANNSGEDRRGWLEDAAFFSAAVDLVTSFPFSLNQ